MSPSHRRAYAFPASHRLSGARAFAAVFDARMRKAVGPLVFHTCPNDLGHLRLGLSVSRRVGTAVLRNRIKRLLREAVRLGQHDWPAGYDLVIVVRPHPPATLAEYQRLVFSGLRSSHQAWDKRQRRQDDTRGSGDGQNAPAEPKG